MPVSIGGDGTIWKRINVPNPDIKAIDSEFDKFAKKDPTVFPIPQ